MEEDISKGGQAAGASGSGKPEAQRISEALGEGAMASFATCFFCAGASSRAVSLAWPGNLLDKLDGSRGRAEAMVAMEDALPGWICVIDQIPAGERKKAASRGCQPSPVSVASITMRPHDGSSELEFKAVSRGADPTPAAKAIQALDDFLGGASLRGRHEGPFGSSAFLGNALDGRQRSIESMFSTPPKWAGFGIGLSSFVQSLESQAQGLALREQLGDAKVSVKAPRI